jgi:uncharacterized protein (UPF0335 family)
MLDSQMKETAADAAVKDAAYRVTASELRQFVERAERIASEIADLREDAKDVFAEAKARGYDAKALRKLIALRKRDASEVAEEEAILDLYKEALGMGAPRRPEKSALGFLTGLGTPVPLTEKEEAAGYKAAFIGKDGTRCALGTGVNKGSIRVDADGIKAEVDKSNVTG